MHRLLALAGSLCALVTVAAAICAAQEQSPPSPIRNTINEGPTRPYDAANPPRFVERYPRYRVQSGDTFDILFEFSPEFNQTVSVQPDGYITLREVGDLHVAGQTVPQTTEALRTCYGKILYAPSITIVLKDFEKPYFIVDGQVGKPGKYDLRGDTTVTQAVGIAGGFLDSAKHSQVVLFRRVSDEWVEARIINIKKMFGRHDLKEDMHLQPGDMLLVPKNFMSKIQQFLPRPSVGMYAQSF